MAKASVGFVLIQIFFRFWGLRFTVACAPGLGISDVGFTLNARRSASSSGSGMRMLSPVRGTSLLCFFTMVLTNPLQWYCLNAWDGIRTLKLVQGDQFQIGCVYQFRHPGLKRLADDSQFEV